MIEKDDQDFILVDRTTCWGNPYRMTGISETDESSNETDSDLANECQYLMEIIDSYRLLVSEIVRGKDMCLHEGTEYAVCDFIMGPNHKLKKITDAKKILYDNYATPLQDFSVLLDKIKQEELDGLIEFDEFGRVLKD